jgi:ACR3 family arsenite efflux pump ArsB
VSKKIILDLLAVFVIVVFVLAIYVIAPLRAAFLGMFCQLDTLSRDCVNGTLLLYLIPMFAGMWLVIRFFMRLTKSI